MRRTSGKVRRFESLEARRVLDSTVVFNELMYNPVGEESTEWIELHNQMSVDIDLTGWSIRGVDYSFPDDAWLEGGGYLVIAKDPQRLRAATDLNQVLGPFEGRLDNAGEELTLLNASDRVMDRLDYGDRDAWPDAADGTGVTLAKRMPLMATAPAEHWRASLQQAGTPGEVNFPPFDPTPVETQLVTSGATWSYLTGQSAPSDWNELSFDDTSWSTGDATLFAGVLDGIPQPDPPREWRSNQVVIPNPSFEFNRHGDVGYGEVEGWGGIGNLGINPTQDNASPFADNGEIPDGQQIAFIQGRGSLATVVSELEVGRDYWFEMHYNARDCCGALPQVTVSFQSQVLVPPTTVRPVDDGDYHVARVRFTATASTGQLLIRNVETSGDHTLLLDAVSMQPVTGDVRLLNAGFEASVFDTEDDLASQLQHIAGWNTEGGGSVSAVAAPEVAGVKDGSQAIRLNDDVSISQSLEGLTVGALYEVSFVAGTASQLPSSLTVSIGDQAVQDAAVGQFARNTIRFIASAPNETLRFSGRSGGDGIVLDQLSVRALASPLVTEFELAGTTQYFRRDFEFDGDVASTQLVLEGYFDDAAVVYVNGQEVDRVNLPSGRIDATTAANESITVPTWSEPFFMSAEVLVPGRNVLAVELHQAEDGDGDAAFDLQLSAVETPRDPASRQVGLRINELPGEVSPTVTRTQVELRNVNQRGEPISLTDFQLVVDGVHLDLPEGSLAPGERGVISVGTRLSEGDLIALKQRDGGWVTDARHVAVNPRGLSDDVNYGESWFTLDRSSMGQSNDLTLQDSVVINEIMYHHLPEFGDPGVPPTYDRHSLMGLDHRWRYNASGALPSDWEDERHEVGGEWSEGPGLLGFDTGAVIEPGINTELPDANQTTFYFETDVVVSENDLETADALEIRYAVDDGAVFYLNGVEFHQFNMREGEVTPTLRAARSVNNAELSEIVEVPKELWRVGQNRISVEVHQSTPTSSDVLFGMELLSATVADPGVAPTPFADSPEEWVELYNRSNEAVDLSGWSFHDAFEYAMPNGTTLGGGEYLVIARDPVSFLAKYPGTRTLGGFSQQLANGGETIVLANERGNVVDEVTYFDRGRWPSEADGGGSSLELIDPRADNDVAENWRASETDATWQDYEVTGVASNPEGLNVPDVFDELLLGLLDEGEVLLDDIQLFEDPEGARIPRLQNGSFENDQTGEAPAAWRWIGNHGASIVDVDPDDASNQVLRLVASGPTEHMHNHGESTLADGAAIQDGQTYQLSFRAKWVSGSPQLNSRLYFARAAATTTLETADRIGTPGRVNGSVVANAGPAFSQLRHTPLVPSATDDVNVFVSVADVDGVDDVRLFYSVDGAAFQSIPMTEGLGYFQATIPAQDNGDVVQFYVTAVDTQGAISQFPAGGAASRAMYRVDSSIDSEVQTLRLIMTRDDVGTLHENSNVMSNGRLGATVIYNDAEVFYDVGVRLRASGYGRQGALAGFNIQFDPGQMFRGVHRTVAIDRGAVLSNGNGTGIRGQSGASPHELLYYQIAHRAGDIAGMYDDVIYIDAPRGTNTGLALLKMARYSDVFLDSQFEDGGDGAIYKYELIYYSQNTIDGDPESVKRAPNAVVGTDIQDLGDDKEAYRFNFVLKNHRDRDDFEGIRRLGETLTASGGSLDTLAMENMDVDQWARTFALQSLAGVADTYNMGLAHNLELYVRPEDGKVLAFPWDVDHGFFYATNSSLLGRGGSNLAKVFNRPQYQRLFYKHLLDIVENAYNASTMERWARHYAEVTQIDVGDFFVSYITQRSNYVMSRIEEAVPQIAFAVDVDEPVTVDSSTITLTGKGWIDVDAIRVAGSENTLDVVWTDDESWRAEVPLRPGEQQVVLEAVDRRGEVVGTDAVTVTSGVESSLLQQYLRVSEVMYNPPQPTDEERLIDSTFDDDDFEFVELVNISDSQAVSLQGLRWVDGPSNPLVVSGDVVLGPGERGVLVGDASAFSARYGPDIVTLATYQGNLSNSGEALRFEDGRGELILEFSYDDDAPWPTEADGDGNSLELIDVATPVEQLSHATRWRASATRLGSPGRQELSADLNRDGLVSAEDIDYLCQSVTLEFDFNSDGVVDPQDLRILVEDLMGSQIGDSNLDGVFDSSDLVAVFVVGQYEDQIAMNSTWATGDWTCDGEFSTSDLVAAFTHLR